jgi:rSAM/selenodomain-associated transferase 1
MSPALVVIAKAPRAGHSKTRLCPPCTPRQAARLARAALADTLDAVRTTPASRHLVVLDGEPGEWLPDGFEVLPQRGGGLGERLANAFEDVADPALLIGMDTPQVTPRDLRDALARLAEPSIDAVLGSAPDGGYWAIGLCEPDPDVFLGVPMSSARTCRVQRARLSQLGLRVGELPTLRDVDRIDDAHAVAELAPTGRFARALALTISGGWTPAVAITARGRTPRGGNP